ncbi:hypothetical protein LF599_01265 [Pseudodesulfovibrio thermohalotolerans]|uniref:hypothetical protein n=1 Tax=Pseudodesulfovibrio thermohalotolerans TaxID=2880651 RepID=UPI002440FE9B|nr:hypothetical protein [Pseudodesulfovibrio thermohalotolerans]WFS62816.1 hypothetical protein LF599_01265 [Pseudodesulfovibrio thermohalotolerans]
MKRSAILLSIILLLPLNAWAQSILPLSCSDVTKIEIWRLRGEAWHCPSKEGYSYAVIVYLTKEAQERMAKVYASTEETPFMVDGCRFIIRHVQISANGKPIRSDAPASDNFQGKQAVISKKTKAAAFEAASQICPAKVPETLLTDGS